MCSDLFRFRSIRILYSLVLAGAGLLSSVAEVTMPEIFGDHMVLQQQTRLPIWGWASPTEKISAKLGDQSLETVTTANGSWRIDFAPIPNSPLSPLSPPLTLTVMGRNTLVFHDVIIGDVWVASGQSNMEYGIAYDYQGQAAIAAAREPQIRLFLAPRNSSLFPQKDLLPGAPDTLEGQWQVCSPETLGGKMGWGGFSAIGYYFAHEIYQKTKHPVGVIGTYWGGTPAQAWTSLGGLKQESVLDHYVQVQQKLLKTYDEAQVNYPRLKADYEAALAEWETKIDAPFKAANASWKEDCSRAQREGLPPPSQPTLAQPMPHAPPEPNGGKSAPTVLFNGMVAPLIPYAIKGVIWYQGESNTMKGEEYATLFPRLITDWREKWQQGDFPFLFVQLAGFAEHKAPWAILRETQARALVLPNTGMATAIDIGDPNNIHPHDKVDVAHRLALIARHVAYGESVICFGPTYLAMRNEGDKIHLTFTGLGGGLKIGLPPWTPDNTLPTTKELTGFEIAGDDRRWVPATASIDGFEVTVTSPDIPLPVAVRYDWADAPSGNLYNQENLPAYPFRTDSWELSSPALPVTPTTIH